VGIPPPHRRTRLQRELERLRRDRRIARRLTLAELVETYLAQHDMPAGDDREAPLPREALPRHQTAHAALLADILDVLHGSSPAAKQHSSSPPTGEFSPGEVRVLRYLPTNLSRHEIAGDLSVWLNTVSTHVRSIYAKPQVRDRSSAVRRARELRLLAAGRPR
jgi:ATP/maltotriose-dependent transcriptional regulator MalT